MFYRLQRKFILICTVSVLTVVTLIFGVILTLNVTSINRNMDMLADRVSEGGGKFPIQFDDEQPKHGKLPPRDNRRPTFITPETPFATRHFTVFFDGSGAISEIQTDSIYSITESDAAEYAKRVINNGKERGWVSNYRYKIFITEEGRGVVFVDGSISRVALLQSVTIAGAVLLFCAALVLILIFLLSKKAVKPIAESYEKQKQFVTDANHELKTPLTLILANLDIAEAELGKNEWLDDIRFEGERMTELVNRLVELSRMDEDSRNTELSEVRLGELVTDITSEFEPLAKNMGKKLLLNIDQSTVCVGNEALLRRLLGILMDNAVKYCDSGGEITVTLRKQRRVILTVENTYAAVTETELTRLFDRFYRADKARRFTGGYGVGLSMAKVITDQHRGEITAYKKDNTHIGFKVTL